MNSSKCSLRNSSANDLARESGPESDPESDVDSNQNHSRLWNCQGMGRVNFAERAPPPVLKNYVFVVNF